MSKGKSITGRRPSLGQKRKGDRTRGQGKAKREKR